MSLLHLSCRASQRPVGQGGFYSARIKLGGQRNSYSLVYDCGSTTKAAWLQNEILEFSAELENRPLDLLVLSHLDADHVNGVDRLLLEVGGVKDVFLPYLSPLERLLCMLRFPNEPSGYYALLGDPVGYLMELGAENVYLVGAEGEEGGPLGEQGNPNDIGPDGPVFDKHNDGWHKEELRLDKRGLYLNLDIEDNLRNERPRGRRLTGVQGVSDRHSVSICGLWRFKFFQKEGLRFAMEAVLASGDFEKLRTDRDEERCRRFLQAISEVLGKNWISHQSILDAILDPETRRLVRKAYSKIANVHNEVSLCLWHGPETRAINEIRCAASGADAVFALTGGLLADWPWWRYQDYCRPISDRLGGTVLMGDINLTGLTLKKFKNHFTCELDRTAFMQLPHHGSRHNFDSQCDLIEDGQIAFVSAGLRSPYLHPHLDLIESLRDRFNLPMLWSHERRGVQFEIDVYR